MTVDEEIRKQFAALADRIDDDQKQTAEIFESLKESLDAEREFIRDKTTQKITGSRRKAPSPALPGT